MGTVSEGNTPVDETEKMKLKSKNTRISPKENPAPRLFNKQLCAFVVAQAEALGITEKEYIERILEREYVSHVAGV